MLDWVGGWGGKALPSTTFGLIRHFFPLQLLYQPPRLCLFALHEKLSNAR